MGMEFLSENPLELVMMFTQHGECTKNHRTVPIKMVKLMLLVYLNKL